MFEKLVTSNLLNFLIMLWLLSLIWKKAKLSVHISNLAEKTRRKIEESKKRVQDALLELEQTKENEKDWEAQRQHIAQDSKNTASLMEKNIANETELSLKELQETYNVLVEKYGIKAKKQTVAKVYDASLELAKEHIEKNMNDEVHKDLINKGIDDIKKMDKICL
ncbi:F-type H+-transporting ATPase subunit b' [Candidatus Gastranaerophilus sp. (ex Termes propinquus)]|nr:F-type H+-transporting ATPase subunit b' [Candidatus Gastranaerophilus sp. (ex Termes propinquus)]